jgi:tol-pal system protein YbgF
MIARNVHCLLISLAACMLAMQVAAAVPIEESVEEERAARGDDAERRTPTRRSEPLNIPPTIEPSRNTDFPSEGRPASQAATPTADSAQLSELFYQMQVLQQEIQTLRGQMEEQDFLIRRLQRDQTEKYADVDRRLAGLSGGIASPTVDPTTPSSTPRPATSPPSGGYGSERDAYTYAFEEMRARRFDESIQGFQQLIVEYPNGQYTPNAYYWLGELYLAKAEPEQSRQSFMQVVSLYPDHQKVPDALYKLGVVYDNLGDARTARQYLERVQSEHPRSSAASLAAKYANELQ